MAVSSENKTETAIGAEEVASLEASVREWWRLQTDVWRGQYSVLKAEFRLFLASVTGILFGAVLAACLLFASWILAMLSIVWLLGEASAGASLAALATLTLLNAAGGLLVGYLSLRSARRLDFRHKLAFEEDAEEAAAPVPRPEGKPATNRSERPATSSARDLAA